jgi:Cysteine-rich secretory protein family/Bacterial TSP3 repeat
MGIFKRKIKDSDADGILDKDEKALGTNPKNSDTDQDGVGDYQEINIYGTNPLNPDSDGDGMNDGNEIKKGRNPLGSGLLKDLFIPCETNNYHPQALVPKRLFFYSISAIVMKVIVVFFAISLPLTAWLTPDLMMEQARKIISLTNEIRSSLGINVLVENNSLNNSAYSKAQDMLVNQYFSHTSSGGKRVAGWLNSVAYDYQVAGENLAMGFSSPENVVQAWTKSATHYSNIIDSDFTEIGVGVVAGWYNEKETTLVAQHFGAPKLATNNERENILIEEVSIDEFLSNDVENNEIEEVLIDSAEDASVLSFKEVNLKSELKVDITIDEPEAQSDSIVRAEAYLNKDIVSAEISFNEKKIQLNQDINNRALWTGSVIVSNDEQEEISSPFVPANIKTVDKFGNTDLFDVDWKNIKPLKTTVLDQYLFLKSYSSKYVQVLFSFSAIYYQILLVIACLAFILNIFIKIKKQNFQVIFSSAGFIILLVLLLVV